MAATDAEARATDECAAPASDWVLKHQRRSRDLLAPGFTGPFLLLGAGLVLGLVVAPGPGPDWLVPLSYGMALGVYGVAAWLARRGQAGLVAALLVGLALVLAVLAFGPSSVDDRKVTAFNAWAFALGGYLPPLISPPPHPNAVAGLLAVALGLAGAAALGAGARRWWLAAGLAMSGALLLTASRAGWLAAAAGGLVLAGAWRPGAAWVWRIGAGFIVGALALYALGDAGLAAGPGPLLSTYSLSVRLQQWDTTRTLLQDSPLVGLGVARFPGAYAAAVAGSGHRAYETPANTLLQVWADAGALGLAALAWIGWRAARLLRPLPGGPGADWLGLGLAAALVALAVDGLFESITAIVWRAGAGYGYWASPLPFLLLGLLAGHAQRARASGGANPDDAIHDGREQDEVV